MMARKMSQPVWAVSLELLTASSRLYGLTGVSGSGALRPMSTMPYAPTIHAAMPTRGQTLTEKV